MAITTIGSYLTTYDEFIAHWDDVNLELGGAPATDLTLQGGYARDGMIAARAALQAAITDLEDKENDRQIAASARDITKDELRDRLSSFRGMLQGKLPGTPYLAAAPKLPRQDLSESKFLAPLDDMASLWAKVNADTTTAGFTPPLLLAGGYDLATFITELAELRAMYAAVTLAENDQRIARKQRDAMLPAARARMVQYRTLVEATFGETHPMTMSMPTLNANSGPAPEPPPGTPPQAVVLNGAWSEVNQRAEFWWTPSNDPNVQFYSLRRTPGPAYDWGAVVVVDAIPPEVETANTNDGLAAPGDTASFKVYAVTDSGGEAGSNTVTITRP